MSKYAWSKTPGSNTSVEGIHWGEGMARAGVNNGYRAGIAALAQARDDEGGALTSGGSEGSYTLTTNQAHPTNVDGMWFVFVANHTNPSGGALLDRDGTGNKKLRKITQSGETALDESDIVLGGHYRIDWDASADSAAGAWIILNPTNLLSTTSVSISALKTSALTPHENLIVKYVSATDVDVDADAVYLFNSIGIGRRFTGLNVTIDITDAGEHGLDTGSEAPSTWYYIHGLGKEDGTLTAVVSTSTSAPTKPSGYVYAGLLGAVYNDASSNFAKFFQRDTRVIAGPTQVLAAGSSTTFAALDLSSAVPAPARAVSFSLNGDTSNRIFVAPAGSSTTSTYGHKEVEAGVAADLNQIDDMPLSTAQAAMYRVDSGAVLIEVVGYHY